METSRWDVSAWGTLVECSPEWLSDGRSHFPLPAKKLAPGFGTVHTERKQKALRVQNRSLSAFLLSAAGNARRYARAFYPRVNFDFCGVRSSLSLLPLFYVGLARAKTD